MNPPSKLGGLAICMLVLAQGHSRMKEISNRKQVTNSLPLPFGLEDGLWCLPTNRSLVGAEKTKTTISSLQKGLEKPHLLTSSLTCLSQTWPKLGHGDWGKFPKRAEEDSVHLETVVNVVCCLTGMSFSPDQGAKTADDGN